MRRSVLQLPFRLAMRCSVLQLMMAAAVASGFSITKTGHRQHSSTLEVAGVGGGTFDVERFSSWHYDARSPLIHANAGGDCPDAQGNIYNANCVNNGETDWNIFFGGWDGVDSCHDSVSVAVTGDSFATVNPHVPVIATGTTHNLNNPSATKTAAGKWLMVYTQEHPVSPPSCENLDIMATDFCMEGKRMGFCEHSLGFSDSCRRSCVGCGRRTTMPARTRTNSKQLTSGGANSQGAPMVNKPGMSSSTDGVVFSPAVGGGSYLEVHGYPYNWTRADVNGGNVLLQVNDSLHLYFVDFKSQNHSVYLATAPMPSPSQPPPAAFTFQGIAVTERGRIVNDVKVVNGHFLMGMHCNGPEVFYSASKDPNVFPASVRLFEHRGPADAHIVSLGFVVDHTATRVLGALYGAGGTPTLNHNQIFAAWLQRHVLFVGTDSPPTVWGVGEELAVGPDTVAIPTNAATLEGRFMVYDTDYRNATSRGTLLYSSKPVMVEAGDTWALQA